MAEVRDDAGGGSDRGVRALKGGAERGVGPRLRVLPRAGVIAAGPCRPHEGLRRGRAGVHLQDAGEVRGKIEGWAAIRATPSSSATCARPSAVTAARWRR